jgi:DNA-binding transcriptional MerR regulator
LRLPVPETEIPKRALFKASEVCEIASVQPYVLRSWESEFPDLGVSKADGGSRVYRRADVERVLRIKQLVFSDGLTLAGVRRRIDDEAPVRLDEPPVAPAKSALGRQARERLLEIRNGLRAILDLLSSPHTSSAASSSPSSAQAAAASMPRQARLTDAAARPAQRGKAPARRTKPAARPAARKSSHSRR